MLTSPIQTHRVQVGLSARGGNPTPWGAAGHLKRRLGRHIRRHVTGPHRLPSVTSTGASPSPSSPAASPRNARSRSDTLSPSMPDVRAFVRSGPIAGSPLRQTDIDVRGSVSVVGVRPIHDPVTDTPRAPRRARAATRTLGPLSCADALSLHRRFAISTSCALAAADVRLEQEAHRARY